MTDRMISAQAALIGSMLIDSSIVGELVSVVPEEDFTEPVYRNLFAACKSLHLSGKPVDAVLLASAVPERRDTVVDCLTVTPTAARWKAYAAQLREDATVQRLREAGLALSGCSSAEEGAELTRQAAAIFDRRTNASVRMSAADGLADVMQRMTSQEKRSYIPWGFSALDGRVRCYPGKFVIIGGYPSSGKTALALNMALSISRKFRVGIFSLETDFETVYNRLSACISGVDYGHIQDRQLSKDELKTMEETMPYFRQCQITVERASRLNVESLQAAALAQRYEVIIVDYLQLLDAGFSRESSRYEQTTRVSMELHRFAQDRGVCVIGLSQLSRPDKASKGKKRATMSDLRESGQLEQDADVVMILNEDTDNPDSGDRLLYIDKNKDGRLGMVRLAFEGEYQRFTQRVQKQEPRQWKPLKDTFQQFQEACQVPKEFTDG